MQLLLTVSTIFYFGKGDEGNTGLTQRDGGVRREHVFLKVNGAYMLTSKRNGGWEFEKITLLQSEHSHAGIC